MHVRPLRISYLAMFVSSVAVDTTAYAGSVTLQDNYWGGINNYNPSNGDVIGTSLFNIKDAIVTKNGNQLTVVIETNFNPSAPGADGTTYGTLFFNPTWNPAGTAN